MKTTNITYDELREMYEEALDCEGTVTVGGLEFYPSRILAELDPIAYECGLDDYYDSLRCDNYRCEDME